MLELRTYTLASNDALEQYAAVHWKWHIPSLADFGITTHHVWKQVQGDKPRLVALIEYAAGADPEEVTARYMSSEAFRADMEGFSLQAIVDVRPARFVRSGREQGRTRGDTNPR